MSHESGQNILDYSITENYKIIHRSLWYCCYANASQSVLKDFVLIITRSAKH